MLVFILRVAVEFNSFRVQRNPSRGCSCRRNSQAVGQTNEPTRKPSHARITRQFPLPPRIKKPVTSVKAFLLQVVRSFHFDIFQSEKYQRFSLTAYEVVIFGFPTLKNNLSKFPSYMLFIASNSRQFPLPPPKLKKSNCSAFRLIEIFLL